MDFKEFKQGHIFGNFFLKELHLIKEAVSAKMNHKTEFELLFFIFYH